MRTLRHRHGDNVVIYNDVATRTILAHLSTPGCGQPRFNRDARWLFEQMAPQVFSAELPCVERRFVTRMAGALPEGMQDRADLDECILDVEQPVVIVDMARAGIMPSMVCQDLLNYLGLRHIRVDHLMMQRVTNSKGEIAGAEISGNKIDGSVDGQILVLPDPMGATGTSMVDAITTQYVEGARGVPSKIVTLSLVITPEFIERMQKLEEEIRIPTKIYALRLDRGLTDHGYIFPGIGDVGAIMNGTKI